MLRVLHSVSNMDRAGIETMLMNYYRKMDRTRIQFDFLANKPKPGDYDGEIRSMGGRVFVSPGLRPDQFPAYVRFFGRLLADNPDIGILHAHNEGMAEYPLAAARAAGLPVRIAHAHSTRINRDWKWPWKVFCKAFIPRTATHFFACGRDAGVYYFGRRRWEREGVLVPNAVDLGKFAFSPSARRAVRERFGVAGRFVVGHVGRFTPEKNHLRLLRIFARLSRSKPEAVLWLAGDGELLSRARDEAGRLGIAGAVRFWGLRDDVADLCQAMDAFVMPSLYEGLPVVGVEAQAAGLPCLFSTGVPSEACILPGARRLPLSAADDEWARAIAAFDVPRPERAGALRAVRAAGYDLDDAARKLSDFYLRVSGAGEAGRRGTGGVPGPGSSLK